MEPILDQTRKRKLLVIADEPCLRQMTDGDAELGQGPQESISEIDLEDQPGHLLAHWDRYLGRLNSHIDILDKQRHDSTSPAASRRLDLTARVQDLANVLKTIHIGILTDRLRQCAFEPEERIVSLYRTIKSRLKRIQTMASQLETALKNQSHTTQDLLRMLDNILIDMNLLNMDNEVYYLQEWEIQDDECCCGEPGCERVTLYIGGCL
ncbi:uncharacterized protein CTRU02_214937 [Colletotrichum truncatum]|uniref:Uncharacterized protein n=1 Tax=Colletotrichum truncatum TaxID=5467 RepID=A0ACC3YE79_COLTU|nr:uncharacterized protein CTRU02_08312 [Colletotrichum truncatum]KAF6790183.1 hypothetical protein CTRU02_08312 [Colletotrichum truncatum]